MSSADRPTRGDIAGIVQETARLSRLLSSLKATYPRFALIPKEQSALCRAIDRILRIVTLGGQSDFMTHYVTTLGQRVYVPKVWEQWSPNARYIVMRHEAVHMRQFRKYTWPGMVFLYLGPILPMGLAYFRAKLEWEAYAETLIATAECYGLEAACSQTLHAHIVRQFCSSAYGWMWPFPKSIEKKIVACIESIRSTL